MADPQAAAVALASRITSAHAATWAQGSAADWAQESFGVAKAIAYTLNTQKSCAQDSAPITLPDAYVAAAHTAANLQLEKAGVRLAWLLGRALGQLPAQR